MRILIAISSPVAAWNIPVEYVERLRRRFPQHEFIYAPTDADVVPLIPPADVAFIGEINPAQFAAARALRWIHSPAAGIGGMLFPALLESPVVITNSRGMSSVVISEHVIALTLALFRKLQVAIQCQMRRHWGQDEMFALPATRTISGSDVLMIGLGGIGAASARLFAGLGARVSAIRRNPEAPAPAEVVAVHGPERLTDHLSAADVVVVAAPQTSSTRRMIGKRELDSMRRTAVLINVSRGTLVDQSALAEALANGVIGGAGLDVFEQEPLDAASPLWTLPNVVITPHTSGFRPDHWEAASDLFAENLRRYEAGEPLLNVVDKTAGY